MEASAADYIMQIGVGGIFAVLVIRQVLEFLKTRNAEKNPDPLSSKCDTMVEILKDISTGVKESGRKTSDLHKWHDVKDRDGTPIWYYRKSMEEAIARLDGTINKQVDVLSEMSRRQERQVDMMARIVEAQDRLWDKMQDVSRDLDRLQTAAKTPLPRVESHPRG